MLQTYCASLQEMTRLGRVEAGQNLLERWPAGSAARRRPFERWELKLALVVRDERGRESLG
jgi:hypothetical protein